MSALDPELGNSMEPAVGDAGSESSSPPNTPSGGEDSSLEAAALAAAGLTDGGAVQQTQTQTQQQQQQRAEHGQAQQAEAPPHQPLPAEVNVATNDEVRIVRTQYPSQPHSPCANCCSLRILLRFTS